MKFLKNNLFLALTLRLELFTALVTIPNLVYFVTLIYPLEIQEELYAIIWSGIICGIYTIVWGITYRYYKIRSFLRTIEEMKNGMLKEEEKVLTKINLLHYPYKECIQISLRWIVGCTTGLIFFTFFTGKFPPVNLIKSLYLGLLIVLPMSIVIYLFTTEYVIRNLLSISEFTSLKIPGDRIKHIGYFPKIFMAIIAVTIAPVFILGHMHFFPTRGSIVTNNPSLHIGILSFQSFLAIFIMSYRVAKSIQEGISFTNTKLSELGSGNLNITSGRTSADEFGEQGHHLGFVIEKLKNYYNEIKEMNETLELKIFERTQDLNQTIIDVHTLKTQQDGDYFLTSLLSRPLFVNKNISKKVETIFVIKQKKTFDFRKHIGDLGGDLCLTGNLLFGKEDELVPYTMAFNGDAMGKSMQGAGGSLITGVVMNLIMKRSQLKSGLDIAPEFWLKKTYTELNGIFKTFDGSMMVSGVLMLINDLTGDLYLWNAEHPFCVLYRDGNASYLENAITLRKIGIDTEMPFTVKRFRLKPNDIVILGSDGREDILVTNEMGKKEMNHDSELFLKIVDVGKGDLHKILDLISQTGEVTDDLSLLRVFYKG
jgi:hypothetical protein